MFLSFVWFLGIVSLGPMQPIVLIKIFCLIYVHNDFYSHRMNTIESVTFFQFNFQIPHAIHPYTPYPPQPPSVSSLTSNQSVGSSLSPQSISSSASPPTISSLNDSVGLYNTISVPPQQEYATR